jgi:hypothetical protein
MKFRSGTRDSHCWRNSFCPKAALMKRPLTALHPWAGALLSLAKGSWWAFPR